MEKERAALAAAWQRESIPPPAADQQAGGAGIGIEAGMGADVELSDEGLAGARFSAAVRGLRPLPSGRKKKKPTEALVEYDTLFAEPEEDDGSGEPRRLQEWVPISSLHPVPPQPPEGWIARARPGDRLDGLYEGGWWTVVIIRIEWPQLGDPAAARDVEARDVAADGGGDAECTGAMHEPSSSTTSSSDAAATYVTEVVGYGLERTFCAADLRPCLGSRLLLPMAA